MDPLYKPGVPLGWSSTRIAETLDRGLVAQPVGAGKVYLSWRLLASDSQSITFNVCGRRSRAARHEAERAAPCG